MTTLDSPRTAPVAPPSPEDLLHRTRTELRPLLRDASPDIDRDGVTPEPLLQHLAAAGLAAVAVPARYGGTASGDEQASDLPLIVELLTEIAAGDSSVGQVWMVHLLTALKLFDPRLLAIDEDVRARLAAEVLGEGARLSGAAAEPGRTRFELSFTKQPVPGGLLLDGVKVFCTGHQFARYSVVSLVDRNASALVEGLTHALVPLPSEGVTDPDDWDNMGQRATGSGSLHFRDVFVPDHHVFPMARSVEEYFASQLGPALQLAISAVILGIGYGALEAAVGYVQSESRPWPPLESASDDPYIRSVVGRVAAELEAARALQGRAAEIVRLADGGERPRAEASVAVSQSRIVTTAAALRASTDLFRVAGARSTSNRWRLDRFLRSARTLTVHDPVDRRREQVGDFLLNGTEPPRSNLS